MKKFLVCGDVEGNFDVLNQKIQSLQQKGQQFDFLLCIGNSLSLEFNIQQYKSREKRFAIRTYFIDSSELSQCLMQKYPVLEEICPNFFFLGRAGLQKIEGLNICFLNGVQSHSHSEFYNENHFMKSSFTGPYFNKNDLDLIEQEVKRQGDGFLGVDILLSNEWPFGFENNLNQTEAGSAKSLAQEKSLKVAQIADLVCPRYHFAARNGVYYARPPYLNRKKFLTRFIAFGKVASGGDQKYLSAYQVQPLQDMSEEDLKLYTEDMTQNPYSNQAFLQPYKTLEEEEVEEEDELQRRINENNEFREQEEEEEQRKSVSRKQSIHQPFQITENVFLHVGHFDKNTKSDDIAEFLSRWGQIEDLELVYDDKSKRHKGYGFVKFADLKTAQQALSESGHYSLHGAKINFKIKNGQTKAQNDSVCWFCFNSPDIDQSLIFYEGTEVYMALDKGPLMDKHFLIIPKDHIKNSISLSMAGQQEVKELMERMNKLMMRYYNKIILCFERYMRLSDNKAHMIIQCVPIDIGKTDNFRHKFENGVRAHRLNFMKMKKDEEIEEFVSKQNYYFYLELYGKDKYLYAFKDGVKFHYDFGRQIICEIFSIARSNWKDCIISEKELELDIQELKFQLNK